MIEIANLMVKDIAADKILPASPEFIRHQQVFQLFGIRRGKLYQLLAEGKIRAISLRKKGQRFSCRLFYVPPIRAYLYSLLQAQEQN